MWATVTWAGLRDPEIAETITDLRRETVQTLLWVGGGGYVLWHYFSLLGLHTQPVSETTDEVILRRWAVFVLVIAALAGLRRLLGWRPALAVRVFPFVGALLVVGAMGLLQTPDPWFLLPLCSLAATVLLHPLAGGVLTGLTLGLLLAGRALGLLPFLADGHLWLTMVAALSNVVIAWALGLSMVRAVEWSLESYAQARRHAQAARQHRAELARALKQLDTAYYRLQQANAALELAWKTAEAAERAKSEFVTNISHELRTPLNLIVGFSELILTAPESYGVPLPAPYRSDLMAIYRSAQHLLSLTNDIIDLTRVGIGRLALVREPVDLGQVVRDACDLVRDYLAAKGLSLQIVLPPDLPLLQIDRLRVRQVLLNLLTNAARFTERGGVTVSVSQEPGWVTVRVTDTGRGIDPALLPHLFDEFSQAPAPGDHGQWGSVGLGLPISRKLVELHGGQMGVESTVGVGTTFWFTLPVSPAEGQTAGEGWRPVRAPVSGARERVLVLAGDDGPLARLLERHLRGYRLVPAATLTEALRLAGEVYAVAILADIAEPGPPEGPAPVPVIRLPLPRGERLAAALGVAAYLIKPVTRRNLQAALDRLGVAFRRVLIVDDDPRFVRFLHRLLRTCRPGVDLEVREAYSGSEALEALAQAPPDLVVLDLVMPEVSGYDLLRVLRQDPVLASRPVIVVSAYDGLTDEAVIGCDLMVHKGEGFRFEEVLGTVEALLGAMAPPRQYLPGVGRPQP